jgi:hypothetical protein
MTPEQVDSICNSHVENTALKYELKAYKFFNREVLPFLIEQKLKANKGASCSMQRFIKKDDSFSPSYLMTIIEEYGWNCSWLNVSMLGGNDVSIDVVFTMPS